MDYYSEDAFDISPKDLCALPDADDAVGQVVSYCEHVILNKIAPESQRAASALYDLYAELGMAPSARYLLAKSDLGLSEDKAIAIMPGCINGGIASFGREAEKKVSELFGDNLWGSMIGMLAYRGEYSGSLEYWSRLADIAFELEEFVFLFWVLVMIRLESENTTERQCIIDGTIDMLSAAIGCPSLGGSCLSSDSLSSLRIVLASNRERDRSVTDIKGWFSKYTGIIPQSQDWNICVELPITGNQ